MNTKQMKGESDLMFSCRSILMGAAAAMAAEAVTIPTDTAKVRLQLQTIVPGSVPKYSGMLGTMRLMSLEEGTRSLYSGLTPALQRQFVYSGLRVGFYESVRNKISGPLLPGQQPTFFQKILAGITTGAIATTVANPTDLNKLRM